MGSFCFIDKITEVKNRESITAFFELKGTEKFLKDHFQGFPVMPGVLLLEVLKQAACALLNRSGSQDNAPFYRLARVDDVKFGQFVRPGSRLKAFVRMAGEADPSGHHFEGRLDWVNGQDSRGKVLSAEFQLVPVV